jgi:hypothetical protein
MRRRVLVAASLFLAAAAVFALTAARTQPPGAKPATGNVRDHGAKGDGVGDDTAAVQAAVDAGAGVVHFPKGVYKLTKTVTVDLDKVGFTCLTGGTVARVVMAGEGPAFKFVGTHGGTAGPSSVKENVWDRQRMPGADGLEIVGAHDAAVGIEAAGTMKLTLTRVAIRRCLHGVHLTTRNRNVIISDSHVYHNRGVGVFLDHVNLHQINVTGSHISYNDGGGVVVLGGEVRNLQVSGCDIEYNHGKEKPPTANVLVDSTGGSNAEVAITGCTLQHTRTVPGSANIRIKGPSKVDAKVDERRDGHVTITGNVLSDTHVNVHLDYARGVVITGNTFWTGVEYNLLVEHSTNVVVGVNNVDRNPRYFREEDGSNDAVLFRHCTDCTVNGLHVSGVRRAAAAVAFEDCDRFNVSNLAIYDSDNCGLLLKNVTRSRVAGCLIRDDRPGATSEGIREVGGRDTVVEPNPSGRPVFLAPRDQNPKP